MRFVLFLVILIVLSIIVLFVMGNNRTPPLQKIEQEIELNVQNDA